MLYIKIPALPKVLHQLPFGAIYQAYLDDDVERPLPFGMTLYPDNTHVFDIRTVGVTLDRVLDSHDRERQASVLTEAFERGLLPTRKEPNETT